MSNFDEQAAGFFAAEGHFHLEGDVAPSTGYVYRRTSFRVGQTERYWLDVLRDYYDVGRVRWGKTRKNWEWQVNVAAETLYVHFLEQPITWLWVVGFWEGDGTIERGNYNPAWPKVGFGQAEANVTNLTRIYGYLGVGNINGPYPNGGFKKDSVRYELNICGENARELTFKLYDDVISPRRKEQLRPYVEAILAHGPYRRAREVAA
jgi:hypothetical protein